MVTYALLLLKMVHDYEDGSMMYGVEGFSGFNELCRPKSSTTHAIKVFLQVTRRSSRIV